MNEKFFVINISNKYKNTNQKNLIFMSKKWKQYFKYASSYIKQINKKFCSRKNFWKKFLRTTDSIFEKKNKWIYDMIWIRWLFAKTVEFIIFTYNECKLSNEAMQTAI